MEILYKDNKLIVAVKPRGVLSTDEPGGMPSLLREALDEPTAPLYTVHRLDAQVSGVMVYARTRHAASDLGKAMQSGDFHKEYLAVIHGRPEPPVGVWNDWLRHDTALRRSFVTDGPMEGAKEARLSFAAVDEADGLSLAWIELHTGRTHQIRCQFAAHGFPLWGDRKYGIPGEVGPIALWSCALNFSHPVTGDRLHFSQEPPREFPWTLFLK